MDPRTTAGDLSGALIEIIEALVRETAQHPLVMNSPSTPTRSGCESAADRYEFADRSDSSDQSPSAPIQRHPISPHTPGRLLASVLPTSQQSPSNNRLDGALCSDGCFETSLSLPCQKRVCRRQLFESRGDCERGLRPLRLNASDYRLPRAGEGVGRGVDRQHMSRRPSPLRLDPPSEAVSASRSSSSSSLASSVTVEDTANSSEWFRLRPHSPVSPTRLTARPDSTTEDSDAFVTPPSSPRATSPRVCPGAPMKPRARKRLHQHPSASLSRVMRPLFF